MQSRIATLLQGFQILAPIYLGKRFVLTSGDRTCERQLEISGPNSYHVVGLAFDGVLAPYESNAQAVLGAAAQELGFRWGGAFKDADVVHFDDGNRGAPGRCTALSGSGLVSSLGTLLQAFAGIGRASGAYPGVIPSSIEIGGVSYSTNKTGGAASETLCGPEQRADGSFTGRVTCEPYRFSQGSIAGFDSF